MVDAEGVILTWNDSCVLPRNFNTTAKLGSRIIQKSLQSRDTKIMVDTILADRFDEDQTYKL